MTHQQYMILEAMADGAELVCHSPDAKTEIWVLRLYGADPIPVATSDAEKLKRGPRKIRHARTDAKASDIYMALTPTGYRAIGRDAPKGK